MSISPDTHNTGQHKIHSPPPTIDSEREEFRKYLEGSPTLDVMTKIIKEIYEKEERPSDPFAYYTNALGLVNFEAFEATALKDEIRALKKVIEELEEENKFLKEKFENIDVSD